MGQQTKIQWCDSTWSPVTGCTKVSPACDNCYAERMASRLAANPGVKHRERYAGFKVAFWPERLAEPVRWKKPRRIFVCSMADLFHEDVPDEWIDQVFAVAALAPQHTFMMLTKRPDRMLAWFQRPDRDFADAYHAVGRALSRHHGAVAPGVLSAEAHGLKWPLPKVWLGATVEDQQRADERIPILLQCPADTLFVSCEPTLGPIDLTNWLGRAGGLNWVIEGAETGPGARPAHPAWFRSLRDQCQSAGVPYFFKGWGEWQNGSAGANHGDIVLIDGRHGPTADSLGAYTNHAQKWNDLKPTMMARVGKKRSGRLLDGREWNEFPH